MRFIVALGTCWTRESILDGLFGIGDEVSPDNQPADVGQT
jgi:hypothetical protein